MQEFDDSLFHRTGFICLRGAVPVHDLSSSASRYLDLLEHYRSGHQVDTCDALDWARVKPEDQSNVLCDSAAQLILEVAAKIFAVEPQKIRLSVRLFNKPPGAKGTPSHQDCAYENAEVGKRLNFWIPLDDVSPKNGAMFYFVGSHTRGVLAHEKRVINGVEYLQLSESLQEFQRIELSMSVGDLVLHHDAIVHGAYRNETSVNRRALVAIARV